MRPLLPIALAAVLAASCAAPYAKPPREKEGREYGVTSGYIWRSNWWNFYERGQSFADGGFVEDAVQDFRWALERRDADQRNARTYGMHFLDDYFPHRELGIALYRQRQWEEAQRELITSLEQAESARAKFYLNEVRREILKQKTKGPRLGPAITVESPRDGLATAEPFVWVTGTATSDSYVETLDLNGDRPRIELAKKKLPFRARVPLVPGANPVRITASDLLGGTSEVVLTVRADRSGPAVAIRDIRVAVGGTTELEFEGEVSDDSGVADLRIGGRAIGVTAGGPGVAGVRARVPRPADGRLELVAVDRVGNRTEATIVLAGAGSPRPAAQAHPILLAAAGALPVGLLGAAPAQVDSSAEDSALSLDTLDDPGCRRGGPCARPGDAADDPSGLLLAQATSADDDPPLSPTTATPSPRRLAHEIVWRIGEAVLPKTDRSAPVLRLYGFEDDEPITLYLDRIFITGNAHDEGEVTHVAVNGEPIARARGRDVLFSTVFPLDVGDNRIVVTTTDAAGRSSERTVSIRRERPAIRDPKIRLAVAPLPFKQGESVGDLSEVAQGYLLDALVDQRRYRVLEREKLSAIMAEQELSASDLIDPANAIDLGNLAAADGVLMGRIYRRAGSVEAWIRLVDTETTEVLATADIYGEDPDLAGVQALMRGLAQKVALAIPIVEEPVVSVDGDEATMAKGTAAGLRPSLKVALFRPGAPIVRSGQAVGTEYTSIAVGRVRVIASGDATVELGTGETTRIGDLVVVR